MVARVDCYDPVYPPHKPLYMVCMYIFIQALTGLYSKPFLPLGPLSIYLLPTPVLTLLFIGPFREMPPLAVFFIVYMNRMLPMHLFYHAFQKDQPMCLCSSCYENDGFHSSSCSYL